MRQVTSAFLAGCVVTLLIGFVTWRARTFRYCAGGDDRRPRFSIVSGDQSCGADEESTAFPSVCRAQGLKEKARAVAHTVAKPFVP